MRDYREDSRFIPPVRNVYDFRYSQVGPAIMGLVIVKRHQQNQEAYDAWLAMRIREEANELFCSASELDYDAMRRDARSLLEETGSLEEAMRAFDAYYSSLPMQESDYNMSVAEKVLEAVAAEMP